MGQWLDPLLFFVADASAERNWSLAARAMDTFSACITYGSQLDVRPCTLVQGFQGLYKPLWHLTCLHES